MVKKVKTAEQLNKGGKRMVSRLPSSVPNYANNCTGCNQSTGGHAAWYNKNKRLCLDCNNAFVKSNKNGRTYYLYFLVASKSAAKSLFNDKQLKHKFEGSMYHIINSNPANTIRLATDNEVTSCALDTLAVNDVNKLLLDCNIIELTWDSYDYTFKRTKHEYLVASLPTFGYLVRVCN
jgi:hypothetical protein